MPAEFVSHVIAMFLLQVAAGPGESRCLSEFSVIELLQDAPRYGWWGRRYAREQIEARGICTGESRWEFVRRIRGDKPRNELFPVPPGVTEPQILNAPWQYGRVWPDYARFYGLNGNIEVRLTITGHGMVQGCQGTAEAESWGLVNSVCVMIREHGRFEPARDAQGLPTMGNLAARVTWGDPPPFNPPARQSRVRHRSDPSRWVTNADYPSASLRAGEQGLVRYMARVGANGRAFHCETVSSSGFTRLDRETCRQIMRRSRFHSALDNSGIPTADTYTGRVFGSFRKRNNPIPVSDG